MKGKTLSAIGLVAVLIGVALIFFHTAISKTGIILTGGVLFVATGVINFMIYGQDKGSHGLGRLLSQLANAAAIVLGICLLVFSQTFVPLVSFIFGLLLAVCALWQFFILALGTRPHQLPGWLYVFPLLLTGASIYVFVQKNMPESTLLVVVGVSMAVLGAGCIVEGTNLGMARRAAEHEAAKPAVKPAEKPAVKAAENDGEAKHTAKAEREHETEGEEADKGHNGGAEAP